MSEELWKLPKNWVWSKVGEVANIVGGGTPPSNDAANFQEYGIAWITPADLTGYQETYISKGKRDLSLKGYESCGAKLMPKGTVLFSSRAPIGYCAIAKNEIATNQGFKSLVLSEGLIPEFVRYYLLEIKEYAESIASGTTFKELSGSKMATMPIPLAPTSQQRRIVAKLDTLFTRSRRAREELGRVTGLCDRYKQAVLEAAFLQVSGSPLYSLGELTQLITSGSRGWAKYYSDIGAKFIRVGNVVREGIDLDLEDMQMVSPPKDSEGTRTRLQVNDIVVTVTADLGRIGIIPVDLGEAYINQHVALVRLIDQDSAKFIAWYLVSQSGQDQLLDRNRGMTRAGLGLDDIRAVNIPLPSIAEQKEIVRQVEKLFKAIDLMEQEYQKASKLCDRLEQATLAKAFRGELVPQNPDDEPASALLERILTEQQGQSTVKRSRAKKTE